MNDKPEALTKVYVDLPNHWWLKGESMWVKDLGGDLYELRNVPFCAYGLNHLDVVRATVGSPGQKPEIRKVVRRSGHRTLRVIFESRFSREEQDAHLAAVMDLGVEVERANENYVCLDILPSADYDAVCNRVAEMERQNIWTCETCEQRVPGSFDDAPDE